MNKITQSETKENTDFDKSRESAKRFPWKLYKIVKDCKSGAIGWDESGRTVLVRPEQFKREFLDPENSVFKTKNLGSFVRQLNLYGFHKLQSIREGTYDEADQSKKSSVVFRFQNDLFIRGRPDLLGRLHRNVGIRKEKQVCINSRKHNAQESRVDDGSRAIGSKLRTILPSIGRCWSLSSGLDSPAELASCRTQVHCLLPVFCNRHAHLEISLKKAESHEMKRENDLESNDVTMVKKEDFEEIVSAFGEVLKQDPDVHESKRPRMDCSISTVVHDMVRRAKIVRDYQSRLKRCVSETTSFLPIHDSSFSFSADASTPIFKVADNHVTTNDVKMSIIEQSIHNQMSCMDFDNYKENLAYI